MANRPANATCLSNSCAIAFGDRSDRRVQVPKADVDVCGTSQMPSADRLVEQMTAA
jgi:hypothetical protein